MIIALWIVAAWSAIMVYAIVGRGMYFFAVNYSYSQSKRLSWWLGFFWPVTTVYVLILWSCYGLFYIPWCIAVDFIGGKFTDHWERKRMKSRVNMMESRAK